MTIATPTNALLPRSPIAKALAVIGDRWTLLVLREMFLGKTRFSELVAATGASRATLTKRLRALVANGLLYQNPYQSRPPRVEYRLTDKGFALYDLALAIWQWESRWASDKGIHLPPRLRHRVCGHKFMPHAVCGRCSAVIDIHSIGYRPGTGNSSHVYANEGTLRRTGTIGAVVGLSKGLPLHYMDVIADHWTPLVVAAAFMGMRRFEDMRRELGIATNILSHRLRLLVESQVLQPQPGGSGARMEYRLTDKGRALIVPTLAMHLWSLQWLPVDKSPSMVIFHNCAPKKPIQMRMDCSHCLVALRAQDVSMA